MFYTYAHYTPQGRLFYIGKGSKKRAYSFYKRGNHWNNVVNKYGKPIVKILAEWEIEQDAFSHEIKLIAQYFKEGVKLCNKTIGGEGTSGYKHTLQQRENNRQARLGKPVWNKGIPCREETKQKLSLIKKGKPRKPLSKETKLKISLAKIGHKHSEETKRKCGLANIGKPTSAKQKAIASQLFKGNNYAAGNTAQRKWIWVGTHIKTGEVVKYIGQKEMKCAGLQHSNIIQCLNGKRKSYKGYTWSREAWSWH